MNPLGRFLSLLASSPSIDQDTQAGLRRIAEMVDKSLAMAPGFSSKLAAPIAHAREYCARLVDALPPVLDINRKSFATQPLVHALFASADDIGAMVASSAPVRAYLDGPQSWMEENFVALMSARRVDKNGFGVALQGGIIATDVPQLLLQFSNQTLTLPTTRIEVLHDAMRAAAFDSLLRTFAEHLEQTRTDYKSLQTEREMERVRQRSRPVIDLSTLPSRHIAALDERLKQQFMSLQPDVLIGELADFLMKPEQALRLNPVQLWVTRSGVIQDDAAHDVDVDAASISFVELTSRDRRRHIVLPVRIRCDKAREALAQAKAKRTVHENTLLI